HREGEQDRRGSRPRRQPRRKPEQESDRRDQGGRSKADGDIGANIGSVATRLLAQDRQPQPSRQERADHRGKAEADDIDTIVGGPAPAGEHDYIDQSQSGGNDIPREIDRAFAYEHRRSPVDGLFRSPLTPAIALAAPILGSQSLTALRSETTVMMRFPFFAAA